MKVVTIRNFEMPESCSGCRFLEVFAEGGRISGQCRMTGVFEYDRQALGKRRMECCMLEELDVLGWRKTGGNVHFISLDKTAGEWAEEILSVPSNTNLQKSKISGEIREKYDIFAVKEMLHEILS